MRKPFVVWPGLRPAILPRLSDETALYVARLAVLYRRWEHRPRSPHRHRKAGRA